MRVPEQLAIFFSKKVYLPSVPFIWIAWGDSHQNSGWMNLLCTNVVFLPIWWHCSMWLFSPNFHPHLHVRRALRKFPMMCRSSVNFVCIICTVCEWFLPCKKVLSCRANPKFVHKQNSPQAMSRLDREMDRRIHQIKALQPQLQGMAFERPMLRWLPEFIKYFSLEKHLICTFIEGFEAASTNFW